MLGRCLGASVELRGPGVAVLGMCRCCRGWSRTRSCPSVSSQLAAAAKPSFHRLPKAAGVFFASPPVL